MLKKIVFLGAGGTIAGVAPNASDNVGYLAGQLDVKHLLGAIPTLQHALGEHAMLCEQVVQLDSKDMGWVHWCALAQRIHHYLAQSEVHSIVVTHGTDTLEETAFFLSRVLGRYGATDKPVVLTCAMRPASSMTPDGPQNVLDAVAVACSDSAHGVLVVCAGTVHSAKDVQKVHPYRLNAFDSGDAGPLGYVEEGTVRWMHACSTPHTAARRDALDQLSRMVLPRVEIVMSYVGATGATVRSLCANSSGCAQPVRGIVVAGTGNGTIHEDLEAALREVQDQGVRVVRSTRCAQGQVIAGSASGGFAHSNGLTPVKARVALMLDLLG